MRCWKVRQVGQEWHVIETRFVDEPEYILARCSGPVPAGQIAASMFLAQRMNGASSSIHNNISDLKDAFERFKLDLADAQKAQS